MYKYVFTCKEKHERFFSESMKASIFMRFGNVLSFKVCKSCDAKRATAHFHKSTSESHSFNFLMCLTAWAWSLHCVWHIAASPRLSVKCRTLWSAKRVPLHCDYDGFADRRESCSDLSAPAVPPRSPAAAGKLPASRVSAAPCEPSQRVVRTPALPAALA